MHFNLNSTMLHDKYTYQEYDPTVFRHSPLTQSPGIVAHSLMSLRPLVPAPLGHSWEKASLPILGHCVQSRPHAL